MGSPLQWIQQVFRALIIRNAAGTDMPAEPALKIIGATLSDDSANGQTVLTIGAPAVYRENGSFNVTDTSGEVYVGLHALAADATVKAPSNPELGFRITVKLEDTSLDAHHAIFDANGGTVTGPEASGGTYTITKEQWGDGPVSGPSVDFVCVDVTSTPLWMAE
jgi:hypothetical protein